MQGPAGANLPRAIAIGYTGPPGTIPIVSMNALLKPDALRDPTVQSLKTTVPFDAGRDVSPILLRQIAKDIGLTVDELLAHR